MRKLIAFVFASALLSAGLYLLFLQLFVTSHLVGQALDAAGLLITLGAAWLSPQWFRFGASSLANDILMQLVKEKTGLYQSADYFAID